MSNETKIDLRKGLIAYRGYSFVLIMGVAGIVMLVVLGLIVKEVLNKREQLSIEKSNLNMVSTKVAEFKAVAESRAMQERNTIDMALPEEKPVFEVLTLLAEIARDTGVVITEYSASPGNVASASAGITQNRTVSSSRSIKTTPDAKKYEELKMIVSIEGDINTVNMFIKEVNTALPLMDVEEIKISTQRSGEKEERKFYGDLRLNVYWIQPIIQANRKQVNPAKITLDQEKALDQILTFRSAE